ncbi:phage tail tape measure protein [Pedobacter sp. WC2423]|uniref:phage tail tape measure protein n=1 Tax=Pedobacter sp. WC2423 TaxID=3234142 RepID=UPI0034675CAA
MGAGQAKIELLLELRNKIKAGMSSARSQINSGVSSMKLKLAELKGGASEAFNSISDQIPGLDQAMKLITNPYALVTAGVVALAAAYIKASGMAMDWAKGMAKVNVTAQLSKNELAALSDQVMDIGARNSTPLEDVPESFNKIVSAGLEVKDALGAFEPILKGAKAGFTDLDTVAAATVATMNSTGIMSATKVLDVLFATMNKGNAEFKDIADYLPKIIPMADKAGQSFEDLAGAFAYFTAQGFKSDQTATLLENTFKAISDPRITDGFKKIGVNIYDAHGKAKPLLMILDSLRTKLKGLSSEAKNKIFKTIGADGETVTAIGAMLKDYDKLKDIIGFTNKAQGQLNEAMKNAETPGDAWVIINNQIKQGMIEIGQTSLPMIKAVGQSILDTIAYWKDLYKNSMMFRDLLSVIGAAYKFLWDAITSGTTAAYEIIKVLWNGMISFKDAIFGAGNGFEEMYVKVKPYILWIFQYVEAIGSALKSLLTLDMAGLSNSFKDTKSLNEITNQVNTEYAELKKPKEKLVTEGGVKKKEETTTNKGASDTGSKNASGTTGTAQQIKNLTINMDSMVKMGDFVSKNQEIASMSKKQLEEWFTELAARMLRNLETSYN